MSDPFELDDIDAGALSAPTGPAPTAPAHGQNAPVSAPLDTIVSAPYLDALNDEQREAVEALDGPVLVLAGAGTGKTRVLTTRLAHILHTHRAWPSQVLAVTFTNKAAREMKERTERLMGGAVEGMPWLGTFHALGAKILRRHAELVGLRPDFTILDTDDQIRLLKQIIRAENVDEKRWPPRQLAGWIDRWKNRGLAPGKISKEDAQSFADGKGAELYAIYQQRLKILNAADFGDLLTECLRLFQENPEVLTEYQERFKYILVDEYQDTNVAQYLWLRLLAQTHKNLCCVGDDDQSIYSWRGAEVSNILRFERDFPGAKVVRLERNYRSTHHILGAASGLIAANDSRLGKELWTDINEGEKLSVHGVWDGEEEARLVAEEVETLQRAKHPLAEVAILVRAGFQMREFEDRFVNLAIPYRVVGGPRFYERLEIRDALAYLRVTQQPDDGLAFERIINKPKRGLGDATLQALHHVGRAQNISLYRAAEYLVETDELRPQARKSLANLLASFARWRGLISEIPHGELAEMILEESGYTEMWLNDRSADAPGRLENLKELILAIEEFESLAGFLEHISLVMDTEQDATQDKLNIMTLHAAKGLEFRTVFLPGWEEGLFPHQRALDEGGLAALEEERRLAYVGITRAKQRAAISFAANRRVHNLWQSAIPSRFIDELPKDHVEVASETGVYGNAGGAGEAVSDVEFGASTGDGTGGGYDSPGWRRARARTRATDTVIDAKATPVTSSGGGTFETGERVFHQKFGYGTIEIVDHNKLTVAFEKAGRKKVMNSFVERT